MALPQIVEQPQHSRQNDNNGNSIITPVGNEPFSSQNASNINRIISQNMFPKIMINIENEGVGNLEVFGENPYDLSGKSTSNIEQIFLNKLKGLSLCPPLPTQTPFSCKVIESRCFSTTNNNTNFEDQFRETNSIFSERRKEAEQMSLMETEDDGPSAFQQQLLKVPETNIRKLATMPP